MLPVSNEARVCKRCGKQTFDVAPRCAHCGGVMTTVKTMRLLGWLLVCLGSFLVLFMGAITIYVAQIVFHTGEPGSHAGFTGGADMEVFMFGLFGLVLLFGFTAIASGAWQIRYGKPNRKLMFVILGLGILFIIIGRVVRFMHH
jgi:phosphate starvation-inducible membrane PsiE